MRIERIYSNITLHTFHVLKHFGFKMADGGINGTQLAGLLDSITSLRFSLLALDISDREKQPMGHGGVQPKQFFEEMKALDLPLFRLAKRILQGTGERFTLILLANGPNTVAGSFTEFQKVGNTWKGERLIGGGSCGYYWTFTAAKDCKDKTPDDSVLRFVTN